MFITTIEEFVKYIPTAGRYNPDPERSDYDIISPFLEEAEIWLETQLLGKDLYNYLSESGTQKQKEAICRVVACQTYYSLVPFVDLIQTPNGFAVVSNTNQAPASKERVERLLEWLKGRLSESIDSLIIVIFQDETCNSEWKKFGLYDYYTECLFMTAMSLRNYGRKNAQRDDLDELHSLLMSYQEEIARKISNEYLDELIVKRRNAGLNEYDLSIIKSLQIILGLMLRQERDNIRKMFETVINTMVESPDKYPTYRNSKAYRIKTSENYVNEKNHPTFIFNS